MSDDSPKKKKQIRNSTAEFLIFSAQTGGDDLEVRYEDETIWLTQKLMAHLFGVDVRTVSEHLANIYDQAELQREATIRNFRIVQTEGAREVARLVDHYNLDAIISVGYRVNSVRATQFRQWATGVPRDFAIKEYVLDRKRMESDSFLSEDNFERLLDYTIYGHTASELIAERAHSSQPQMGPQTGKKVQKTRPSRETLPDNSWE